MKSLILLLTNNFLTRLTHHYQVINNPNIRPNTEFQHFAKREQPKHMTYKIIYSLPNFKDIYIFQNSNGFEKLDLGTQQVLDAFTQYIVTYLEPSLISVYGGELNRSKRFNFDYSTSSGELFYTPANKNFSRNVTIFDTEKDQLLATFPRYKLDEKLNVSQNIINRYMALSYGFFSTVFNTRIKIKMPYQHWSNAKPVHGVKHPKYIGLPVDKLNPGY